MPLDTFTVIAEPTRREILDRLRDAPCSVGELVETLAMSQPAVSKHLRVLREAGFVSSEVDAQRRIYRLEPRALAEVDAWLAPYRAMWTHHLGELGRHLDRQERRERGQRGATGGES